MSHRYDVAVVGGGLVGLSTAYQLLRRSPGLGVVVVEKESGLARHQSGHNSGVLHAGLYYQPGSLRARLCVEGKEELEAFALDHGIPFRRLGKLVVALHRDELPRLEELYRRGRINGVAGLRQVGPEEMRALEPHVVGIRALHVPGTGVIDFRRVALALSDEIQAAGADLLLEHEVEAIRSGVEVTTLLTTRGEVNARRAVTCAGLYADRVSELGGRTPQARIVPFRGDYYRFRPRSRSLVRGLVYPVPDPAFPFLGVHFTRTIDDEVLAGPNAVLAFAREGYRRRDLDLRDVREVLGHPGFRRLARRHWRYGMAELWRDLFKSAFLRSCRPYLPDLRGSDLVSGPSGVRAQAVAEDGSLVDDFLVDESEHATHVQNAPSPAATASLAIGRIISDGVLRRLTGPVEAVP
ncbi:MAG: L-2-hydroxyglutarate oxidase [Actinomycetota bacterium]|nr:L-2-hydroxyglutarate oxidase [Actinomycetota bacterium]